MFEKTLLHDDRLLFRALKTRENKRRFPLKKDWRSSILLVELPEERYFFRDVDGIEKVGCVYGFSNNFLESRNVERLKGVRLRIHRNFIDVELTNILNVEYAKCRRRILFEVLVELWKFGIIRANCSYKKSLVSRLYYLMNYFSPSEYEIRFDMKRIKGLPILEQCKIGNSFYNSVDYPNTVPLSNPKKEAQKKNGYWLKIYDRDKKRTGKACYPIRLELTLYRKRLPGRLKGNSKKIITELENQLYEILCSNKYYPIFSDFLDCVYFQDEVERYEREEIERMGRNLNQHCYSMY